MCFNHSNNSAVGFTASQLPESRRNPQPGDPPPVSRFTDRFAPQPGDATPSGQRIERNAPQPAPTVPAKVSPGDTPSIAQTLKKVGRLSASGAAGSAPPTKGSGRGRVIY